MSEYGTCPRCGGLTVGERTTDGFRPFFPRIRDLEAERGTLRVLLLRADAALCMAIDIDDPHLSPSERDWIITQARGVHGDIGAALQEGEA